jgi:hypothetical protein
MSMSQETIVVQGHLNFGVHKIIVNGHKLCIDTWINVILMVSVGGALISCVEICENCACFWL